MALEPLAALAGGAAVWALTRWKSDRATEEPKQSLALVCAEPDPSVITMDVPADGREVFTPVLEANRVYWFVFAGVFEYRDSFETLSADAVYDGDDYGNFTKRYAGVEIDGCQARNGELFACGEDRANHAYSYLVDGWGRQMSVRLEPPRKKGSGSLQLRIEPLAVGTTPVWKRLNDAAAAAAAVEAEANRRQEELIRLQEEQEAQEERQKVLDAALKRYDAGWVRQRENLLDPHFRSDWVSQNWRAMDEFQRLWSEAYKDLTSNTDLYCILHNESPAVLDIFEGAMEMVLLAQRFALNPPLPKPADSTQLRSITPQTISQVRKAIAELFRLREQIDETQGQQARFGYDNTRQEIIGQAARAMAFNYELLRTYGISGQTPEEAEDNLLTLWRDRPEPGYYEQLLERIKAGERASIQPIQNHLDDLFREELRLSKQRKTAVDRKNTKERDAIDARLTLIRRELWELKAAVEFYGWEITFPDRRPFTEPEVPMEKQLTNLYEAEARVKEYLEKSGQPEEIVHVRNLYAKQRADLLGDDSGYT